MKRDEDVITHNDDDSCAIDVTEFHTSHDATTMATTASDPSLSGSSMGFLDRFNSRMTTIAAIAGSLGTICAVIFPILSEQNIFPKPPPPKLFGNENCTSHAQCLSNDCWKKFMSDEVAICRCKENEHCQIGEECNDETDFCYEASNPPTKRPSTQSPSMTPTATCIPTLSPTASGRPSSARFYSYSRQYEVEVLPENSISLAHVDLCKFADALADLTQLYAPPDSGNVAQNEDVIKVHFCSAQYKLSRVRTRCSILLQKRLLPTNYIRIAFEMTWWSKHYEYSTLKSFGDDFPSKINGWEELMDWLKYNGLNEANFTSVKLVYATSKYEWKMDSPSPTSHPTSPVTEEKEMNVITRNEAPEQQRSKIYTQDLKLKSPQELSSLEVLILEQEVLQTLLSPEEYIGNLPLLVHMPKLSFVQQSLNHEKSVLTLQYKLAWRFCYDNPDFGWDYDPTGYKEYEDVGKLFEDYANQPAIKENIFKKLPVVGIHRVADISQIIEIPEKEIQDVGFSQYCYV